MYRLLLRNWQKNAVVHLLTAVTFIWTNNEYKKNVGLLCKLYISDSFQRNWYEMLCLYLQLWLSSEQIWILKQVLTAHEDWLIDR